MKKNTTRSKYIALLLVTVLIIFCWIYREGILIRAGKYLAPEGKGEADAVIIGGNQIVTEKAARVGYNLFSSGSARKMVVVVIHEATEDESPFGLTEYNLLIAKKLERMGLKRGQFEIFATPDEHPITLREAEIVLAGLSKDRIQTALLVVEAFHMRRSYWAYKKVGEKYGIKIIPKALFIKYQSESWWKKSWGIRDFVSESAKFFYYVALGYIPAKSLISCN